MKELDNTAELGREWMEQVDNSATACWIGEIMPLSFGLPQGGSTFTYNLQFHVDRLAISGCRLSALTPILDFNRRENPIDPLIFHLSRRVRS